jgi:hypothetical protein
MCLGRGFVVVAKKISFVATSDERGMREETTGAEWVASSHGRPSFATRTMDRERGDGRSQRRTHVTWGGSKRDEDASRFQAEKIRAGGKLTRSQVTG